MLSTARDSVVPLSVMMNNTERRIDELEWEGELEEADLEIKFLEHLLELEERGELFYYLF